jgi:iron complex outermembrane receptor protein
LNNSNSKSLSRVLQENGIYLKQYGLTGLATFSLRGADPQQTQVLWNGMSIAGPTTGIADLNIFGYSGSEELVIHQGGTSSFYGSGNVGGTLMINTPVSQSTFLNYSNVFSSYGQQRYSVGFGLKHKNLSFENTSMYSGGNNNFNYFGYEDGEKRILKMNNYESFRLMQRNGLAYSSGKFTVRAINEFTSNKRNPGETLTGPAGGTLWDRSSRVFVEGVYRQKRHAISLRSARFSDYLRYKDSLTSTDDSSYAKILNFQGEWVYRYKNINTLLGFDIQQLSASTEAYLTKVHRLYPAHIAAFKLEKKTVHHSFKWQV